MEVALVAVFLNLEILKLVPGIRRKRKFDKLKKFSLYFVVFSTKNFNESNV